MKLQKLPAPAVEHPSDVSHNNLPATKMSFGLSSAELRLIDRLFPKSKPTARVAKAGNTASLASLLKSLDAPNPNRICQLFGGDAGFGDAARMLQQVAKRVAR